MKNPPKRLLRGLPLFSAVGIPGIHAGEDVKLLIVVSKG